LCGLIEWGVGDVWGPGYQCSEAPGQYSEALH